MESQASLSHTISSKYIFDKIFDYIKDRNFKLKLLRYSKLLQKKFEIKLSDFQLIELLDINFDIHQLFYDSSNISYDFFSKNIYQKNKDFLFNYYDINKNLYELILPNYVVPFIDIMKDEYDKNVNNSPFFIKPFQQDIDIYSIFFNKLIKEDYFKYFSIVIPINIILYYKLENDFKKIFDKMNNLNTNYSSLTINFEENDKNISNKFNNEFNFFKNGIDNLLKSINIDFEKISKLTCIYCNYKYDIDKKKYNNFYKSLLSNFNKNNLVYLDLTIIRNKDNIDIINDFISLKTLFLKGFKFEGIFELKLSNLEKLSLYKCENISFVGTIWPNLKYLEINDTHLKNFQFIRFPNLITLIFKNDKKYFVPKIDFFSLEKLENFYGQMNFIFYLSYIPLKNIELFSMTKDLKKDIKKYTEIIEKIISFKTLKKINFELFSCINDYIKNIKGENNSVTDLKIIWNEAESDCVLYNLQKKFPNLSSIDISTISYSSHFSSPTLDIEEDENSKINKININLYYFNKSIRLYCQCFENIIELKIKFNYNLQTNILLEKFFMIFNKKNKTIFRSLKIFSYIDNFSDNLSIDEINKINFNSMPNLNDLTIHCRRKKLIYSDFIKVIEKILLLYIKNIELKISPKETIIYTRSKLRELFPNIKYNKFKKLSIEKYLKS